MDEKHGSRRLGVDWRWGLEWWLVFGPVEVWAAFFVLDFSLLGLGGVGGHYLIFSELTAYWRCFYSLCYLIECHRVGGARPTNPRAPSPKLTQIPNPKELSGNYGLNQPIDFYDLRKIKWKTRQKFYWPACRAEIKIIFVKPQKRPPTHSTQKWVLL